MRRYQQLTIEEREKIQLGLWVKRSLRGIAFDIGRSVSTISREINRNVPPMRRMYIPRVAHERAHNTVRERGRRYRLKNNFIRTYVISKLKEDLSPEQIAGRLHFEYPEHSISPESIYQYIYAQFTRGGYGICKGEDLRKYLKRHHKARKPKKVPYPAQKGCITNRIWIDERSPLVELRREQGHWEGDSMVSKKSSVGLNTLVERVSGVVLISKLRDSTKDETTRAVVQKLGILPRNLRQTLTVDNGHENAGHIEITHTIGTLCYFAHPYHSWERGTNENTNGLIRWYLPKGTDFATVGDERIREIEIKLNNRPRKRLGWRTPYEVFNHGVALEC